MIHKYVKQDGIKDCGVCTLYNIIKYYGGSIDIDKLRIYTKTDSNGTNIYNMVSTARKLGLKSDAFKCELNDLCTLTLPAIAHLKLDDNCYHFVIIDSIVDDEIIIFDPIRGILKYLMEDFQRQWTNIIITFEKTENLVKEKELKFSKIIFSYIKKYRFILFLLFNISLISVILSNINSLFLSKLYNSNENLFLIFILFIIILFFKSIIDYYKNIKLVDFNNKFDNDITNDTFNKILSLPLKFHHERPVGDIVSRFNDLSQIKELIYNLSSSFIIDLLFLVIVNLFIMYLNVNLFLINIILSILYILSYILFRKDILFLTRILKEDVSNVNSFLIESIYGINTIKNLNIEKNIKDKYYDKYNSFLNQSKILNKKYIRVNILLNLISNISILLIVLFGTILLSHNNITLPNLIALNTLIIYYYISLNNIISLDEIFVNAKESTKRINRFLKNKKEITSGNKKFKFKRNICFININHSYNGITYILKNINFSINKNEFIFIDGKSGVGKSTIFKLLTKQYKSKRNTILIDGVDINDISKVSIQNNILYVSQYEYLFTGSILDNIKLSYDITDKELNNVLKITKVDEILKRRNIGIDYLIEENGVNLSGGERQKIILARSLIRNKQILILDETMNEIDPESEREIIKKIKTEYNITLILISHRKVNSDLFDRIINIE